jgi:hypothetical protein
MSSNSEVESYIEELLKEEAAEAPATKTPYPYETLEQKAIAEEIRQGDPNGYVDELIKYNNELLRDCD